MVEGFDGGLSLATFSLILMTRLDRGRGGVARIGGCRLCPQNRGAPSMDFLTGPLHSHGLREQRFF